LFFRGCPALKVLDPRAQELILFSRADLERSIPSMVDGLKPGQRKILFCCFKRNIRKDVKASFCQPWAVQDFQDGCTLLQVCSHNFQPHGSKPAAHNDMQGFN
jgi:hypothetical protein